MSYNPQSTSSVASDLMNCIISIKQENGENTDYAEEVMQRSIELDLMIEDKTADYINHKYDSYQAYQLDMNNLIEERHLILKAFNQYLYNTEFLATKPLDEFQIDQKAAVFNRRQIENKEHVNNVINNLDPNDEFKKRLTDQFKRYMLAHKIDAKRLSEEGDPFNLLYKVSLYLYELPEYLNAKIDN